MFPAYASSRPRPIISESCCVLAAFTPLSVRKSRNTSSSGMRKVFHPSLRSTLRRSLTGGKCSFSKTLTRKSST